MDVKPGLFSRLDQTKDNEDGLNTFWNSSEINRGVSSSANKIDSLLLTQTEKYPDPEESSVPNGVIDHFLRAPQGTSRPLKYSSRAPSTEDTPAEVLGLLSRPDLAPSVSSQFFLNNEENSTSEVHQERLQRDLNTYKCFQSFK
jgi:hypothetical protein